MFEVVSKRVSCPYCGETFDALIDTSAGDNRYTEDCYVCCRPIIFDCIINSDALDHNTEEHSIIVTTMTEDEAF